MAADADRTRAAVAGCGSIGRRHITNLRALGVTEIIGIDADPEARDDVTSSLGIRAVATIDDAWAYDPNVLVVAAPTRHHVSLATEGARRGCSLFIEKPLSHSREGLDELERAARGQVVLVACNMRFHPGPAAIHELLTSGTIGRIVAARAEVGHWLPDWHPEEDYRTGYSAQRSEGGGVILDAIHELDLLRWLVGRRVEAVSCLSGTLSGLDIDTEDTAAVLLQFEGGAIGEAHLDYVQRAYSRSVKVVGDRGTISWSWGDGVRLFATGTAGWKSLPEAQDWEPNRMYVDQMRHFLDCAAGRALPVQDLVEARRVLEIALAAKKSAASGQLVSIT